MNLRRIMALAVLPLVTLTSSLGCMLTYGVVNQSSYVESYVDKSQVYTLTPDQLRMYGFEKTIQAQKETIQYLEEHCILPTNTPTTQPKNTPQPKPTYTPQPTPSSTPTTQPTNTYTPSPSSTPTTQPTNTPTEVGQEPTNTSTTQPKNTPKPTSTYTQQPTPTTQPTPTEIGGLYRLLYRLFRQTM